MASGIDMWIDAVFLLCVPEQLTQLLLKFNLNTVSMVAKRGCWVPCSEEIVCRLVESACCFDRGLEFGSQHWYQVAHNQIQCLLLDSMGTTHR